MHKVNEFGEYRVKGFVKNTNNNEKKTAVMKYTINRQNAGRLMDTVSHYVIPDKLTVLISKMGNGMFKFDIEEKLNEDIEYAWYLYNEKSKEPFYRGQYSKDSTFYYGLEEGESYWAKLFLKSDYEKITVKSKHFFVE